MSNIPTQGNEILVNSPDAAVPQVVQPGGDLTGWIMGRVNEWEDYRNRGYSAKWKQYWRLWRGHWHVEERNRMSERSRLIAPALAQAIETSVSEIEEGVFSKEIWFDITDDLQGGDKISALLARDTLLEDMSTVGVRDTVSEAVLNAAIFGSGIVKLDVQVVRDEQPVRNEKTSRLEAKGREKVRVVPVSIRPDEFIPDPAGKTISDMLGCAHKVEVPVHSVLEKIESGMYRKDALSHIQSAKRRRSGAEADFGTEEQITTDAVMSDKIEVTEYHGKVPMKWMNSINKGKSALDDVLEIDLAERPDEGDGPLVEAIVTIASGGTLLRAMVNPFTMKDRAIIAFPWEAVPGRFWGRGVAEKGLNPQKALDAELRARIDALGYISSPMLGVDSGRIPRGFRMEVKPGKVWLTQGPPRDILQPIEIGNLNAATFNQTGEMERMVQMGTGAFDTAAALSKQSSQSGASSGGSNSMMMGAFVKRSKRAIASVDRKLLQPLIKKSMWRYMQFDPQRYQQDFKFNVKATLGIVAREVEAMQLTQLLGMMPQGFEQVGITIVQGIIDNSAVANKGQIMKSIAEALQPPSEEEQARQKELADLQFEAQKAQATQLLLENQLTIAEIKKTLAQATGESRKADVQDDKIRIEDAGLALQAAEVLSFTQQNEISGKRLDLDERLVDAKIRKLNRE